MSFDPRRGRVPDPSQVLRQQPAQQQAKAAAQAQQANVDMVDLLKMTVERKASDLLITVGLPPMLRIDGKWRPTEYPKLGARGTRHLMYSVMDEKRQRDFEEKREQDLSFSLTGHGRFRVNVFFQRGAVGGVLRTIPEKILSFEEIGLPPEVAEIAKLPRGLVLVTGPTGSGKSTTLAAMINKINYDMAKHIVTVEDPIEFYHEHKRSIINQREIGEDTFSFSNALRGVLRQAPDVILVGEMRDFETIGSAITAAETGHLVMGTLHTNSASEAIDRIIDVFPEAQQEQIRVQLSNNLQAVLTQQLIPRAEGSGRVLAYEFMIADAGIRNLIREAKTHQIPSQIQMGGELGMMTMDTCLADLHLRRYISYDMGLQRCVDQKEYARLVDTGGSAGLRQSSGGSGAGGRAPAPRSGQPMPNRPAQPPSGGGLGRGGRGGR